MFFHQTNYDFMCFEKSKIKHKKYNGIIQHKTSGRIVKIPFGDDRYGQYRDQTGLGVYSDKDHMDSFRIFNYIQRHKKWVKDGYFSPGFFSLMYLW
jgi:hypothetical protein